MAKKDSKKFRETIKEMAERCRARLEERRRRK